MQPTPLQEAIFDGGIRSINFFNGRLLTGQDLTREQQARREADRRIAQAAGDGVAYGLEVSVATPASGDGRVVAVEPGLAVSPGGHALFLKHRTEVALGRRSLPRLAPGCVFENCMQLPGGTYAAKPGIYLLAIAPAEGREGRALTHALDDAAVPCNSDTLLEGVQFRLISLEPYLDADLLQDAARLRNRIAYRCFGASQLLSFRCDPFGAGGAAPGMLAELSVETLSEHDVPLAVVSIRTGIDFIDMWSVRRRITRRDACAPWSPLCSDARASAGEAMFLQFQEHVAAIAQSGSVLRTVQAARAFEYLPAAGILPLPADDKQEAAATEAFFRGLTVRGPAFIEGARLEPLLRASFAYPPIDLASGELVWLYRVRENRQLIDQLAGASVAPSPPRGCLVFASGHMPYQADARFDLSRWNYANFPLE